MSLNYGKEVKLPAANGMAGSGGQMKSSGADAKSFIGITKTAPANIGNVGKIALNGMGKNGTMMLKTSKKNRK